MYLYATYQNGTNKKANEKRATFKLISREIHTITELEIILPMTGMIPAKKVISNIVYPKGRCIPSTGKMISRYTPVNAVLIAEILICAKIMFSKELIKCLNRVINSLSKKVGLLVVVNR